MRGEVLEKGSLQLTFARHVAEHFGHFSGLGAGDLDIVDFHDTGEELEYVLVGYVD